MQQLYLGSKYQVKAQLEYNAKFSSYQYKPISIVSITPKTYNDQLIFLNVITSNTISKNILKEYPNIIQDVIDGKCLELEYSKIKGVSKTSWAKIREKIIENYVISDIVTLLQPLGVTYNLIKKLLSNEPNPDLLKKKIDENPYTLTQINGLGFKRVDELALKIRPDLIDSKYRLTSFITYYLSDLGNNSGHTWVFVDELKNSVSDNVPECIKYFEEVVDSSLFIIKDRRIGLKKYHDIEIKIKDIIADKSNNFTSIEFDQEIINKSICEAENEQGFTNTEEQIKIITNSLNHQVVLISGKAGTGKTTITRSILKIYKNHNKSINACALAARAARRITEATGFRATTIHSLLKANGDGSFYHNYDNPLTCDVLLLDEASMVNAKLFLSLLLATKESTRIIIVGDHMQLPPIGFGNIFSDLLMLNDIVHSYNLTKVLRQAEDSGITKDANLIREGVNPISKPELKLITGKLKDMYYMFRETREGLRNIAISTYLKTIEDEGADEVILTVPRRKNCVNSVREINQIIQEKLLGDVEKSIKSSFQEYKLGAKVVQTTNSSKKGVVNGDFGYITDIIEEEKKGKKEIKCEVTFSNENDTVKKVYYTTSEMKDLELGYAMTTHKLQGTGYKTVICIIDNTHYTLLDNCMLYTMLTRAKKRCLLLAEPKAFIRCIKTSHNERNTWLKLFTNV